jgi:serine/threonine protein kinase
MMNVDSTIAFAFNLRNCRKIVRPTSVEFLVHMSLAAGVASVNSLAEEGLMERSSNENDLSGSGGSGVLQTLSRSEHLPGTTNHGKSSVNAIRHQRVEKYSVTGAPLDLQWRQLGNVEYLTDGGNSWIHTAVFSGKPVVVKTLKPECQDLAVAINEIESELSIHSRLNHENIVSLFGAGTTSKGVRFFVLERLDGGTLTQMLGYDTRIRDRRRRFWRRKQFCFLDVLRIAKAIAEAMAYCHESAIPGCIVMHRDLKPDNIGFTLDGTVKILDFGLAKIVENASVDSDDVYQMSGETGSLRYMAPEVADGLPYNGSADVYSFAIILWELNSIKKPFEGFTRDLFYERVVHGGERPSLSRKWPRELTSLMTECWDADVHNRPRFRDIVRRLDALLEKEKGGTAAVKKKQFLPKISHMIDRHSTWF